MSENGITRRSFLKRTAGAGAALFVVGSSGSLLSACSDSEDEEAKEQPVHGVFRFQGTWLKNVSAGAEFIGIERGVYENLGFERLELLYGGPDVDGRKALLEGRADIAAVDSLTFADAAVKDQLICVGTRFSRSPICITSLPAVPIRKPSDMVGKTIGVQKKYEAMFSAFLRMNNVDETKITKVIVQNDPKPLQEGQVQGFFSWIINQPVTLRTRNVQYVNMMFSDFGFSLPEGCWILTKKLLETDRDRVIAGLRGLIITNQMYISEPDVAADLTLNKYAKDAPDSPDYVRYYISETRDAINSSDTARDKGIGYMEKETVQRWVSTLELAHLKIEPSYFDNSLMAEIFKNGPDLLKDYEKKYD